MEVLEFVLVVEWRGFRGVNKNNGRPFMIIIMIINVYTGSHKPLIRSHCGACCYKSNED